MPVVNALTPQHHPCQALADLLTLRQRFGDLDGLRVAYVGDGNNVARSLAIAGEIADVEVVDRGAERLPARGQCAWREADRRPACGGRRSARDLHGCMGEHGRRGDGGQRRSDLAPYRVDEDLVSAAGDDAIVLHCLPAHPGEEITEGVLYGDRSAVWDQAENRLHAQKALLELLLSDD